MFPEIKGQKGRTKHSKKHILMKTKFREVW